MQIRCAVGSLVLIVGCAACASDLQDSGGTVGCGQIGWSTPVEVLPPGVVARFPTLSLGERLVLAASNLRMPDSAFVQAEALIIKDVHGKEVRAPFGEFLYLYPRVAETDDGSVHLLWGEPAARPSPGAASDTRRVVNLWHSVLSADDDWSEPVLVHVALDLRWNPRAPAVITAPGGRLLVAVPSTEASSPRPGRLRLLEFTPDRGWTARVIRERAANGVSLAWANGALLSGMVGWDASGGGNSLLTSRSDDQGLTWSEPVLFRAGDDERAGRVWILGGGGDHVAMLWTTSTDSGTFPNQLNIVTSQSQGLAWSATSSVEVPGHLNTTVAMDGCGGVHVVSAVADESGFPRLAYRTFRDSAWTLEAPPSASEVSFAPRLALDSRGRVTLVWTEFRSAHDDLVVVMSFLRGP